MPDMTALEALEFIVSNTYFEDEHRSSMMECVKQIVERNE